jgi:hypothetical protein
MDPPVRSFRDKPVRKFESKSGMVLNAFQSAGMVFVQMSDNVHGVEKCNFRERGILNDGKQVPNIRNERKQLRNI